MKRGDLVEVRWGRVEPFSDLCVVLAVRSSVLGGTAAMTNLTSNSVWILRDDVRDEVLVSNPANGDTSWIDDRNARLITEG
jgi:hypothetical protein